LNEGAAPVAGANGSRISQPPALPADRLPEKISYFAGMKVCLGRRCPASGAPGIAPPRPAGALALACYALQPGRAAARGTRCRVRTHGAYQRQRLNILQHQTATFATFQPLNHAGLAGLLLTARQCRKNADGQALGAPWPVGGVLGSTLHFR